MRKLVLLALFWGVALSWAVTTSRAGVITPAMVPMPATRATASVEFFEGDDLRAVIDVGAAVLGEDGNGLRIDFAEANLSGVGANVIRFPGTPRHYEVQIDSSVTVAYEEIRSTIESLDGLAFADLPFPFGSDTYDASIHDPPRSVVLAGGADAVVPEPNSLALMLLLVFLGGSWQRVCVCR